MNITPIANSYDSVFYAQKYELSHVPDYGKVIRWTNENDEGKNTLLIFILSYLTFVFASLATNLLSPFKGERHYFAA